MKLGLALPQRSGVDLQCDVVEVAEARPEERGFDSVWVGERPTFAAPGSERLYGIPGLPWPETDKGMCEPLTAMAAAAAVTERVRIGSSVLVAGPAPSGPASRRRWPPSTRSVAAGSSPASDRAGPTPISSAVGGALHRAATGWLERGVRRVRGGLGGRTPSRYRGSRDKRSTRHDGRAKAGVEAPGDRIRGAGEGFGQGGSPRRRVDTRRPPCDDGALGLWDQIREKATGYGRDASAMECVVRANIGLGDQSIDGERPPMVGSMDQVVEDIVETAWLGADELFIDLSQNEPFRGPRGWSTRPWRSRSG